MSSRDFAARFGGKRAWLRHGLARVADTLGAFQRFRAIDWGLVSRLVFVCHGNICRSPYAEARARTLGLNAASFGLAVSASAPADPSAVRVARNRGIDLTAHVTRSEREVSIVPGDLLVAMESRQAWRLLDRLERSGPQITLLGLWNPAVRPHVQDPYGLGDDYFETCFGTIDGAISAVADRLAMAGSPALMSGQGAAR
jgi:protein-tyrosine phosphatase